MILLLYNFTSFHTSLTPCPFRGPNYFGHLHSVSDRNKYFGNGSKSETQYLVKSCFWSSPKRSEWVQNNLDRTVEGRGINQRELNYLVLSA